MLARVSLQAKECMPVSAGLIRVSTARGSTFKARLPSRVSKNFVTCAYKSGLEVGCCIFAHPPTPRVSQTLDGGLLSRDATGQPQPQRSPLGRSFQLAIARLFAQSPHLPTCPTPLWWSALRIRAHDGSGYHLQESHGISLRGWSQGWVRLGPRARSKAPESSGAHGELRSSWGLHEAIGSHTPDTRCSVRTEAGARGGKTRSGIGPTMSSR